MTTISTGGGAGHLTGCACPFCTSNATTAEVTDVDLVEARTDVDPLAEALVLSHNIRAALVMNTDAIDQGSLAGYVKAAYPDATRFVVEDYDDGNGPDAFLHIYDGRGVQIDGIIAPYRPENLGYGTDVWNVDVAEATRASNTAAAAREGHRQVLALLAEAYPEWNLNVPPHKADERLATTPGIGKGARTIDEQAFRKALKRDSLMIQRTFNGKEWTGPLSSNIVRISHVTDRQVVVSYLDSDGKDTTSGGPMRPMIGTSAVDDAGRVYILNSEGQPVVAYDPMN